MRPSAVPRQTVSGPIRIGFLINAMIQPDDSFSRGAPFMLEEACLAMSSRTIPK